MRQPPSRAPCSCWARASPGWGPQCGDGDNATPEPTTLLLWGAIAGTSRVAAEPDPVKLANMILGDATKAPYRAPIP